MGSDNNSKDKDIQALPLSTLRISAADMAALRVRVQGAGNAGLPEFLYQCLPIGAMSLIATVPHSNCPVSIPYQRQPGHGYLIRKSRPADPDGLVIIYRLQPNRRYEAIEILFQGTKTGVEEFCRYAARWVEKHAGRICPIPGQYAYFAPTMEHWGAILRDCGYVALDPSAMPTEITPEIRKMPQDQLASGIMARIALHRGDKQPSGKVLPVFVQVELSLEQNSEPKSQWIGFLDYQEIRNLQMRPPASFVPEFRQWLKEFTKECCLQSWIFPPGTGFGEHIEWWGEKNRRRTEHEGVDFAQGYGSDGSVHTIPQGTPVRAIADGEIVTILDDYMNKTVVVRHPSILNSRGQVFCILYSHIKPGAGLPGTFVAKGRPLGSVIKAKAAGAPAHLHLTGAWIPQPMDCREITLDKISAAYAPVTLVDFGTLLDNFRVT